MKVIILMYNSMSFSYKNFKVHDIRMYNSMYFNLRRQVYTNAETICKITIPT